MFKKFAVYENVVKGISIVLAHDGNVFILKRVEDNKYKVDNHYIKAAYLSPFDFINDNYGYTKDEEICFIG